MAHATAEDLEDLAKELEGVRRLEKLVEKKPGIFYFKSAPFLHFHKKDGDRWADVREVDGWLKIAIPFGASSAQKRKFIQAVKRVHGSRV